MECLTVDCLSCLLICWRQVLVWNVSQWKTSTSWVAGRVLLSALCSTWLCRSFLCSSLFLVPAGWGWRFQRYPGLALSEQKNHRYCWNVPSVLNSNQHKRLSCHWTIKKNHANYELHCVGITSSHFHKCNQNEAAESTQTRTHKIYIVSHHCDLFKISQ